MINPLLPFYTRVPSLVHYLLRHVINSRRIRRFGPYSNSSNTQVWSSSNRKDGPKLQIRIVSDHVASNQFEFAGLNMDQTCVFDENLSCDQKFRREIQCTKLVTTCMHCHVFEDVVDQTWEPV